MMDPALAERMHRLLDHERHPAPSSCPICRKAELEALMRELGAQPAPGIDAWELTP